MFKKLVITTLLAFLPVVVVQAESNLTKSEPFGSIFQDDPFFQDFKRLEADMDKVFNSFHQRAFNHISHNLNRGFSSINLKTDVIDKGNHYEVIADLPNVDKSNISVSAKDGILIIKAESKKSNEEKKGDRIIRQERFIGSFYRSMRLPKDVNEKDITNEYKDGVLRVIIPKKK
ncbi:small heat shock protein (class I) [hydrothermal vent metagenome]|uniref:Small heat shock protein (Class I) n=1 Tax=hydrothermal vent metagenome TaxID=652676 RepID=A0A1W1EK38_9ZZZZ